MWPGFISRRRRPVWVLSLLLLILSFAPRGFSSGTPVFPFPQKPTFPNSSSTTSQADAESPSGWATSKSLIIIINKKKTKQNTTTKRRGENRRKPFGARERTNNKLNPHMASKSGFELAPHQWRASVRYAFWKERDEGEQNTGSSSQIYFVW